MAFGLVFPFWYGLAGCTLMVGSQLDMLAGHPEHSVATCERRVAES